MLKENKSKGVHAAYRFFQPYLFEQYRKQTCDMHGINMTSEEKANILEFEKNMQQSDHNDKSIDFYRNEYQKLIDEVNQYKVEYEELVRQELEIKNAYQQALDSLLSKME